jgi:hypothetical protein
MNLIQIISFRSTLFKSSKFSIFNFSIINKTRSYLFDKMSAPVTIEELRSKSNQANDLIKKLQQQIEQIKLQTSPEYQAKRAAELKIENEELRKEVDRLVKELEAAEANKSAGAPLVNLTNTGSDSNKPATSAAAPAKSEQPVKQQQQQAQEPKQKQQQQPPKPKEEKKSIIIIHLF